MVELPKIILDKTIADLYQRASPRNSHKRIGQVLCGTNSVVDLNDDFLQNVKFLYQDSPFSNLSEDEVIEDQDGLQRSLAIKYLSLIAQRDVFISGDTPVILFNVDQSAEQIERDRIDAERTIAVLDLAQRPSLIFCPGPASIPMEENGIDLLASKLAIDGLEDYPMVFDVEKHWYVNSKEALASSGLPTPKCKIIELNGHGNKIETCCDHCTAEKKLYIDPQCAGPRGKWLNSQLKRFIAEISNHPLPFVLKTQQTFAGAGTYIVTNQSERSKLLQILSSHLLRRLFSHVTADNAHLKPGTILLSDLVKNPIADCGVTFFVTDDGSAIFLAVSEQMIDEKQAWTGSTINYSQQKQLEEKFTPIMNQIASWLHSYGYCGPVGADILETSNQNSSSIKDRLHIVDLNVRTSGSLALPLLKGHFESRGCTCASSFSITVKGTRDDFIEKWREQFQGGRWCILSWYEDRENGQSFADLAVGGENEEDLRNEMKKVRDVTEEVTF